MSYFCFNSSIKRGGWLMVGVGCEKVTHILMSNNEFKFESVNYNYFLLRVTRAIYFKKGVSHITYITSFRFKWTCIDVA